MGPILALCIQNDEFTQPRRKVVAEGHRRRRRRAWPTGARPVRSRVAPTLNDSPFCTCCSARAQQPENPPRRRLIQIAAAGLAAPLALATGEAHAKPADGDRLVEEEIEGAPTPLRLSDLKAGKPVLVRFCHALKFRLREGGAVA